MKWPSSITFIRHGESQYNALRKRKEADPAYQDFKKAYEADFRSDLVFHMAAIARENYFLKVSDYETPLTQLGEWQAEETGRMLVAASKIPTPDVVFYSPYKRTKQTLDLLSLHWEALRDEDLSKIIQWNPDDRIREQEHGLALLYNDWRVFHVLHPEQKELHDLLGPYWYQYPQGESASQVRDRARLFTNMLIREWAGKHVLVITHHLTILSFRANYERLTPEEFVRLDKEMKPVNCGVTIYRGDPKRGKDGRLVLDTYNQKFY